MKYGDIRPGDLWVDNPSEPHRIFLCVAVTRNETRIHLTWIIVTTHLHESGFFDEHYAEENRQLEGSAIVRDGVIHVQR